MKIYTLMALMILSGHIFSQSNFDIEGHRGCRGLYPENTIVAFIEAVKLGVNTLEMDIIISKDGQVVISHDTYMNDVICTKPDGSPVKAGEEGNYQIYNMAYDEIKKFDCGLRGNPKFPNQHKMAAHKPLLSEVIDSVERYLQEHHLPPVRYNIETKSTVGGDNLYHPKPKEFTQKFYDVIKQKGVIKKCILQSFDVRTLQEMKKIDSTVTTAYLVENLDGLKKNLDKLGFTPDIYSPNYMLVNRKLVKACHKLNIKILPWTVNDEKKMVHFKKIGVDGLISDYPDKLIKVLR